ncbi:MAG: O-antigen ligase family protein [Holophagae bacterium]|jgi:hypothetical protein
MMAWHRLILALVVVGNAVVFAGVDPPTQLFTALLVLVLMVDLRHMPSVPRAHRVAGLVVAVLVVVQLVPLPVPVRRLVQPGFADVMAAGWAPLSMAPWGTLGAAAAGVVAIGVAVTAARIASTRSGLPFLLALIAATGVVLAILGLAGEAGAPEAVMLIRANTGGGSPYGPFVNENHFAQAIELTLPAALVLLAVNARHLGGHGGRRQLAAVTVLAAAVATAVTTAALLRSGSRGGALFLITALVATLPFWLRPRRFRGALWPAVAAGLIVVSAIVSLTWNRLPELEEGLRNLLVIEGVDGNSRWDLWAGTVRSWERSPIVGSGLGSYRYVIGMDKPATGRSMLEQAHNDWLEWLSTTGVVGVAALGFFTVGVALLLVPCRVRSLRFEFRYALAGVALALTATALHEAVGFGLQIPLNRMLLAAWIGLLWGLAGRRQRISDVGPPIENGDDA